MFGLPSLQMIMIAVITPVLIAFAVVNYKENIYSVVTFFVICSLDILATSGYFPFMYKAWTDDNPKSKQAEQPVKTYLNLNAQDTVSLKIDCVRLFNRTLIDQRNGNLEVNMTENFWLKKYDGADEHRWNKIGGKGRADFVDMLERGVRLGAYKEIGGQGKRVPSDWAKIRRLANGEPLPQ